MSLRNKLSRLGSEAPLSRREREAREDSEQSLAAESGRGVEEGAATAPVSVRGPAPDELPEAQAAPSLEDATLATLRAKMDAILQRKPAPARPPAEPRLSELPFTRCPHVEGVLTQRLERLAPSTRVGRVAVDAARQASAEMLALLGLTPELGACDPARALYLDTETTGLGGAGTVAFLIGLFWFDDDGTPVLEQLLLQSPGEETALLGRLRQLVERASMLVTYNGKSFDGPLLETRMVMNRLPALPPKPHLDLLHLARRLHKRRLGACRLVHLESEVLGWERNEDDVPGHEIPSRYGHFLRTGDGEALRTVVDHNAWDVLSMAALVGLYGEPLPALHSEDLVGVARTFRRARAFDEAMRIADAAVAAGAGPEALRARGEIAKARGDKARALRDFEALAGEVDDAAARLELVKLYEHYVKEPLAALELLALGTGEDEVATERRRSRLQRKLAGAKGRSGRRVPPKG